MTDSSRVTSRLLACGAVAGPLFVAVFTAEGATRKSYDAMREPVSALALGDRGWMQRANFVGTGGLMLACGRVCAALCQTRSGLRALSPRSPWASSAPACS